MSATTMTAAQPAPEALATTRARRPPRRVLGVRLVALVEIAVFLAAALALDALMGAGDRFAGVSPHPFWIVVLLASCYYGTNEGLAAALLAAAALLVGNLPEQAMHEDFYVWLLKATAQPILWCTAAVVLGEIRESQRRAYEAQRERLEETHEQARAITDAYERLCRVKEGLEARVAGQLRTVHTMYQASRAIERQDVGEVLAGVSGLVRLVLNPQKFSLFLLNGRTLEAAASEGWAADDPFACEFDASSALFEAIVARRQTLVIADPAHQPVLAGQGMLAGALVGADTGEVVGMLKIESIAFADLHPLSVQNFALLCEWIGNAFANAQRIERLRQAHAAQAVRAVQDAQP